MLDTDVKRVLIYRIGSLGDTVITLPCLHLVERAFPNAKRVLISNRPRQSRSAASMAILGNSGLIHRAWLIEVGVRKRLDKLALLLRIRLYRPQVLIYLSELGRVETMHRDRAFFRLAGLRRIYGMGEAADLQPKYDHAAREIEAEAVRLARNLAELGDAQLERPASWDLHLTSDERRVAHERLGAMRERRYFVCAPGTNRQATDWGRERWRALCELLSARYPDFGMVFVGAAEDSACVEEIAQGWRGRTLNLCGRLAPRETAAVLEDAAVYIGPDSGPMHLASAAGTRCVVAFSARNLPKAWFPFGEGNKILYRKTECAGCRLDRCETEQRRCLTSIGVEEMEAAVVEVIEGVTPQELTDADADMRSLSCG